jgi:DNA-binding response OmpR family regulator
MLGGVTVILVTARSDERDYALGKQMGADDYLTKPFEMADLLSIVARHITPPA